MSKKTVLVTGTLGFIFSNFIKNADRSKYKFVCLDKAVKPYNLDNMDVNVIGEFHFCDLMDLHNLNNLFTIYKPDIVVGGAAESFVDNSITDIMPFLNSNIIGTQNLINLCLKHKVEKYVHISTDEVYGQKLDKGDMPWFESDPLQPRNPYSASKACAEHIVVAAHNTHGLPYQITRSCNVFGPRQKDENLIPHIIKSIIHDTPVNIHGSGDNFRQYIFVEDVCRGFMAILENGKINHTYNIGDENFFTNVEMVYFIGELMKKEPKIKFVADRKAHDFGYKINSEKLRQLGWKPQAKIEKAMKQTIDFYIRKFQ